MSDKNEIIRSAAAQVAENYRKSDILMYGDALRLPSRTAVIEIIRDFQKILFPAYYGDRDLLKLPPEQYSALLMGHVYDKLLRQLDSPSWHRPAQSSPWRRSACLSAHAQQLQRHRSRPA